MPPPPPYTAHPITVLGETNKRLSMGVGGGPSSKKATTEENFDPMVLFTQFQ